MAGLSTVGFMQGAMQGAQFMDTLSTNKQNREMRAEQFNRQKEAEDRKLLIEEFDRDSRALAASGKLPDEEFNNKYQSLGLNKINDDEFLSDAEVTSNVFKRFIDDDGDDSPLTESELTSLNRYLAKSGSLYEGQRVIGFEMAPEEYGEGAIILTENIDKNGKKYIAPITKNRSSSGDDEVMIINGETIAKWQSSINQQSQNINAMRLAKGDTKNYMGVMRQIVLGQNEKDEFSFHMAYDNQSGMQRLAAVNKGNGQFSHWIGGDRSIYETKYGNDGSGGSKNNKGGSLGIDDYLSARQAIRTSSTYISNEERQQATKELEDEYVIRFGVHPNEVLHYQQVARQNGIYRELTYEDIAQLKAGHEKFLADESSRNGANSNIAQTDQSTNIDPASPPPLQDTPINSPEGYDGSDQQIAEFAHKEYLEISAQLKNDDLPRAERKALNTRLSEINKKLTSDQKALLFANNKKHKEKKSAEEKRLAETARADEIRQQLSMRNGSQLDNAILSRELVEIETRLNATKNNQSYSDIAGF